MTSPLPGQLAYLSPVIEKLETFDPDSLHEDNDEAFEIVNNALKQRIKGMDKPSAVSALEEEQNLLEEWLSQPELDTSPAHFIHGVFFFLTTSGPLDNLYSDSDGSSDAIDELMK